MKKIYKCCLSFICLLNMITIKPVLANDVIDNDVINEGTVTKTLYIDAPSDEQILLKTLQRENSKGRSGYDVILEKIGTDYRNTGFKLVGGQPIGGANLGAYGGQIYYKDGNSTTPISISFSIAGRIFGMSVGIGTVSNSKTLYAVTVPGGFGKALLYCNRKVNVVGYKRYKLLPNGVKEDYGYTSSEPIMDSLDFEIRKP